MTPPSGPPHPAFRTFRKIAESISYGGFASANKGITVKNSDKAVTNPSRFFTFIKASPYRFKSSLPHFISHIYFTAFNTGILLSPPFMYDYRLKNDNDRPFGRLRYQLFLGKASK